MLIAAADSFLVVFGPSEQILALLIVIKCSFNGRRRPLLLARFYSPVAKQLLCYYYVADVLQPRLHVDGSYFHATFATYLSLQTMKLIHDF